MRTCFVVMEKNQASEKEASLAVMIIFPSWSPPAPPARF